MAKGELPTVISRIVREDGIILHDSLSEEEKIAFAKRLNRRAVTAVARAHGYAVEFTDEEDAKGDTVTA